MYTLVHATWYTGKRGSSSRQVEPLASIDLGEEKPTVPFMGPWPESSAQYAGEHAHTWSPSRRRLCGQTCLGATGFPYTVIKWH